MIERPQEGKLVATIKLAYHWLDCNPTNTDNIQNLGRSKFWNVPNFGTFQIFGTFQSFGTFQNFGTFQISEG